jgi:hypothetical protein
MEASRLSKMSPPGASKSRSSGSAAAALTVRSDSVAEELPEGLLTLIPSTALGIDSDASGTVGTYD